MGVAKVDGLHRSRPIVLVVHLTVSIVKTTSGIEMGTTQDREDFSGIQCGGERGQSTRVVVQYRGWKERRE